jgi:hypothetical protein
MICPFGLMMSMQLTFLRLGRRYIETSLRSFFEVWILKKFAAVLGSSKVITPKFTNICNDKVITRNKKIQFLTGLILRDLSSSTSNYLSFEQFLPKSVISVLHSLHFFAMLFRRESIQDTTSSSCYTLR